MSLSDIQFPDDNPFYRIKVRHTLLGFIFFFFIVVVWYGIIVNLILAITKLDFINHDPDPILEYSIAMLFGFLTCAWLWRQCNLAGINIKYIIGKVPKNYRWLSLIGLVITKYFFLVGIFRIFYYSISFWTYSWVENKLKSIFDNNKDSLSNLAKTFSPGLYLLLDFLSIWVLLIFFIFFCYGIAIHRWTAKWGLKKTILYFCILTSILSLLAGNYLILTPIIYILFDILIYFKTRTLFIVFIGYFVELAITYAWGYSIFGKYDLSISLVKQLRDRVWVGGILLAISTPFLARFFYQNWYLINEPLPYFTNAAQEE